MGSLGILIALGLEAALSVLPAPFGLMHWLSYVFPPVRFFDYFAGIMLAIIIRSYPKRLAALSPFLSVGSIVLFGCIILYTAIYPDIQIWYYSVAWLMPSLMIIVACMGATARRNSFWKWTPLVSLGNVSMEFFLIHWLVIKYLGNVFNAYSMPIVAMILLFIISVACAWGLNIFNKKIGWRLTSKKIVNGSQSIVSETTQEGKK